MYGTLSPPAGDRGRAREHGREHDHVGAWDWATYEQGGGGAVGRARRERLAAWTPSRAAVLAVLAVLGICVAGLLSGTDVSRNGNADGAAAAGDGLAELGVEFDPSNARARSAGEGEGEGKGKGKGKSKGEKDKGDLCNLSFPDLAMGSINAALSDLAPTVKEIVADVNLGKRADNEVVSAQSRAARKVMLRLRDMLTIFQSAYLRPGADESASAQPYYAVMARVKVGFDALGELHDLVAANVEFSESLLKHRQKAVLAWAESTPWSTEPQALADFVNNPNRDELVFPRKKKPSRYETLYWAGIRDRPSLQRSGLSNIAVLLRGMVDHMEALEADTLAISSLVESKRAHDDFHYFRKVCRSIMQVFGYWEPLLKFTPNPKAASKALGKVDDLYDMFGDLNDLYTAYELNESEGLAKKSEVARSRAAVEKEWANVKAKLRKSGLRDLAKDLRPTTTESKGKCA